MNNYVIIEPYPVEPPTEDETQVVTFANKNELMCLCRLMDSKDFLALDLETAGLYPRFHREWHTQSFGGGQHIVMVGLFQPAIGPVCIHLTESYRECLDDLVEHLTKTKQELCGHNFYFDYLSLAGRGTLQGPPRDDWQDMNWVEDSFWRFRTLATEGFTGQSHSLKTAQVNILGWSYRGDAKLSEWLKANKLKKCDMYMAPPEMLGHYCALDAFSTYHLCKHLRKTAERWPAFAIITKAFLAEVRMLIANYYAGIPVDVPALAAFAAKQGPVIDEATKAICTHPDVAPILERDWPLFLEAEVKEPPKFKKTRELGPEPEKFTKTGAIAKRWELWQIKNLNRPVPEITKQWERWHTRLTALLAEKERLGAPKDFFNIDSSSQIMSLMYEDLQFPVLATKRDKNTGEERATGGKDAYPGWGKLGVLMHKRKKCVQRKCMSESWLQNTDPETGLLHPLYKIPGTTTTRLSGSGGVNVQNPVKDPEFLDCLREPDPDNFVWVDSDLVGAESVILAYVTQDAGYLSIYGPGAKPNDIYIFLMAHIPGMKELTQQCGYDPFNPTKEAMKKIKHEHKELRSASKTAVLSLGYGSGKKKLHQSFLLKEIKVDGKPITRQMSDNIYDLYWKTFSGVKKYGDFCKMCWERTGGYVLAPFGIPVAACDDKVRKLPNHNIQLTCHLFTMLWIMFTEQRMDASGLEYHSIVADFHDQQTMRVRYTGRKLEDVVAQVREVYRLALDDVNKLVGSAMAMQESSDWGFDMTKFKVELPEAYAPWKALKKQKVEWDVKWDSFDNFFKDMGECAREASLVRTDLALPYCKDNCKWKNKE